MRNKTSSTVRTMIWGIMTVALLISFVALSISSGENPKENMAEKKMTLNKLTPEEERVIVQKGTEPPFTGELLHNKDNGTYTCKRCDTPLFKSTSKFDSGCGWPSFDDEIEGAIKRVPDADDSRTEIVCATCDAHLGHVFVGEGYTDKDVRHCVNSISMNFVAETSVVATEKAYFAGGCFWGVEHLLKETDGVISTSVGYMGGSKSNPSYKDVSYKNTGHAEAVEVVYDPSKTSYEALARLFFEIHDPTQRNRQGPDVGEQYRSVIFYVDEDQKQTSEKLIEILKDKGYDVATELVMADMFWIAEDYHQDYYDNTGKEPYCHVYTKRF